MPALQGNNVGKYVVVIKEHWDMAESLYGRYNKGKCVVSMYCRVIGDEID